MKNLTPRRVRNITLIVELIAIIISFFGIIVEINLISTFGLIIAIMAKDVIFLWKLS